MIVIACDHAGPALKDQVIAWLGEHDRACEDLGVNDSRSVDYPDLAHLVAGRVADGAADAGILICGTGLGMSMAANRFRGVRAALCHDALSAEMARRHNDANVLCLGARLLGVDVVKQIVSVFLTTPFDGGRHQRRIDKIERDQGETA